jgi:hypothetical protein
MDEQRAFTTEEHQASSIEVDQLLRRHGKALEACAPEIAARLTAGECRISVASGAVVRELREVYSWRAKHLSKFSSEHGRRLARETAAFADALQQTSESECTVWSAEGVDAEMLVVFEGAASKALLGCMRVFDDRLLMPEQRVELWGPNARHPVCPNCSRSITTAESSITSAATRNRGALRWSETCQSSQAHER